MVPVRLLAERQAPSGSTSAIPKARRRRRPNRRLRVESCGVKWKSLKAFLLAEDRFNASGRTRYASRPLRNVRVGPLLTSQRDMQRSPAQVRRSSLRVSTIIIGRDEAMANPLHCGDVHSHDASHVDGRSLQEQLKITARPRAAAGAEIDVRVGVDFCAGGAGQHVLRESSIWPLTWRKGKALGED